MVGTPQKGKQKETRFWLSCYLSNPTSSTQFHQPQTNSCLRHRIFWPRSPQPQSARASIKLSCLRKPEWCVYVCSFRIEKGIYRGSVPTAEYNITKYIACFIRWSQPALRSRFEINTNPADDLCSVSSPQRCQSMFGGCVSSKLLTHPVTKL